jgi:2-iminobutanoate/2-iminopropanoate deaminase
VFENLRRTLDSADASMDDVFKLRYSIIEREYYETVKEVRDEYLSEPYPVGMLAVVNGLADSKLLVEIEALAAIPE